MRTFPGYFIRSFVICQIFAVVWGGLPSDIQKCSSMNNDICVAKTIKEILKRYPTGNAEFNMPNLSAFDYTNLTVSRSKPTSPIQINFNFIKCTTYGLEKTRVVKSTGFDKELKNAEINAVMPRLILRGDYEMIGKILLLPINGKGKGEVELRDCNVTIRGRLEKFIRNNKTYFKVKKIKSVVEPQQMIVNFENLFNGNEVLSKTLNEVINKNWRDVWTELQDGINHAMEKIIEKVTNNIYQVLTIEDMYSD